MRLTPLALGVAIVGLVGVRAPAQVNNPAGGAAKERAGRIKYPIGPVPEATHTEAEAEGPRQPNPYLARAYPGTTIDEKGRAAAYDRLKVSRRAIGIPHVNAGWSDRPEPPVERKLGPPVWCSIGPTNVNGRVTSIAIDPNDPRRVVVGTVGGIWRSTDRARRWQRVSDDLLASTVAAVAIHPRDGRELFAALGDPVYAVARNRPGAPRPTGHGIWRSTRGGDPGTWEKVSPPEFDDLVVHRLRVDPDPPHDVYAATSDGVHVGRRAGPGLRWDRLGGFDGWTTDLAVDVSTRPHTFYAGVAFTTTARAAGIWKYDVKGWRRCDSGIDTTNSRTIALALAASRPGVLYAKVEDRKGYLLGLYRTQTAAEPPTGGDVAWFELADGTEKLRDHPKDFRTHWYYGGLEVDPGDADIVFCGGRRLWRSTTGGRAWEDVTTGTDPAYTRLPFHDDVHAVAFEPGVSGVVYVGGDGGLNRSTDMARATWHWSDVAHGMVITEFYNVGTQHADAPIVAGGAQDNGTSITFGNRTWYYNPVGDGSYVAIDPANSCTLYVTDTDDSLFLISNPVVYTAGGGRMLPWTSNGVLPAAPLAADHALPRHALAAEARAQPQTLLKTVDGLTWDRTKCVLPKDMKIRAIAVAPSSRFGAFYVALYDGRWPSRTTNIESPMIWRSFDGKGEEWSKDAQGLPDDLMPNGLAVDELDPRRAFAAFGGAAGGGVFLTRDGGEHWVDLRGEGDSRLPRVPVNAVVVDPRNRNVLYAATTLGVFYGRVAPGSRVGAPLTVWEPFDEGLPSGVDVSDICVNRVTGVLTIGTRGFGAFQRDVNANAFATPVTLVVRDSVFDRGLAPSQDDMPNPEHPVLDTSTGFYRPDEDAVFRIDWFSSPDIRVDVPALAPLANRVDPVDHVEMMMCPTDLPDTAFSPPGTLLDSSPRAGQPARLFVQVTNQGYRPASNVRVVALWSNVMGAPLPDDFWTMTLPEGGGCGPLATNSAWQFVDLREPCRTIPVVNPVYPEVARFDWSVPANARKSCALLAIIESADDPIDPRVRRTNEVRPWVLVPFSRHAALRALEYNNVRRGERAVNSFLVKGLEGESAPAGLVIASSEATADDRPQVVFPSALKGHDVGLSQGPPLLGMAARPVEWLWNVRQAPGAPREAVPSVHSMTDQVARLEAFMPDPEKPLTVTLMQPVRGEVAPASASRVKVFLRRGGRVVGGYTIINRVSAVNGPND